MLGKPQNIGIPLQAELAMVIVLGKPQSVVMHPFGLKLHFCFLLGKPEKAAV